jgi:hypothetical protein
MTDNSKKFFEAGAAFSPLEFSRLSTIQGRRRIIKQVAAEMARLASRLADAEEALGIGLGDAYLPQRTVTADVRVGQPVGRGQIVVVKDGVAQVAEGLEAELEGVAGELR